MESARSVWHRYPIRLTLLTALIGCLVVLNVAAVMDGPTVRWEYKTVWFRVNAGDDVSQLQTNFTAALNSEASAGWEYVGRCAHFDGPELGVDFVVFRRPVR